MKMFNNLTTTEKAVLLVVFVLMAIGVAASWINESWFNNVYVIEDGFIEWLTVLPLLIVVVLAIRYLVRLASKRHWLFSVTMCLLALLCFFVAGEEISWGQRIFHIESSSFFKKNNAQAETNLHNLVVGGVKVNKLVFSQLLIFAAIVYLTVFPYLFRNKSWFRQLVNTLGIPVVRAYQLLSLIVIAILVAVCRGRNSELLEFSGCFLFMLIVAFPQNKEAFSEKGQ